MGNEHPYSYGLFGGFYGVDRRGWADVSDSAKRNLETAKNEFHNFVKQCSFKDITTNFQYTKKHAIQLHLVGKLRPEFNRYVKKFDAKTKWVKLTENEKKLHQKYKKRISAIYFCNLTINKDVYPKLRELEPDLFKKEDLITEISLFTCLTHIGVPEIDALGWIIKVPKQQKIEQIPKINNLSSFLDEKMNELCGDHDIIYVKDTIEYQNKNKKKKRKYRKKMTSNNNNNSSIPALIPVKKSNKLKKSKKRSFVDLCSSDEDEWLPATPLKKRRK